ncbi:MAG: hypothetical protein ABSE73_18180, partial [Planctomycetota bacterium]
MPLSRQMRLLSCLAGLALACGMSACWIIAWRLAFGPHGSFFTFGFVGDEYLYAQRVQALLPGATATNPINGVCDPAIVSEYYLEDGCRCIVSATGLNAITFVWVWRIAFPLLLAATLVWLARECLQRRRMWGAPLRWAAAAAAFSFLYCGYDLVTRYPPLQGWLHRFPTNIEYPLSVLTALLYIRFLNLPSAGRGAALALAGAAVIYLRPYLAIPWGLALGSGLAWLSIRRALPLRVTLAIVATLLAALAPWLAVRQWNAGNEVHRQMLQRYFLSTPYQVHPYWPLYLGAALVLALSAPAVERRFRPFVLSGAFALLLLPFLCGAFSFGRELVEYERCGAFYFVALFAAGMLALRQRTLSWHGRSGLAAAQGWAAALASAALLASGGVAYANARYDLLAYPFSQYPSIVADLPSVPAYDWIREHTPADALFLVDDGYDWSRNARYNRQNRPLVRAFAPDGAYLLSREDLFQLVARRRRVYSERLYGTALPNADLEQLAYLQRGTFGLPVAPDEFHAALKHFRPTHILWRNGRAP